MKEYELKKVEKYLYGYKTLEEKIEKRRENIIDTVNVGKGAFLKSKRTSSNSVEDIAIRLAEDKKINEMKIIKKEIEKGLLKIKCKNIKIYNFVIYKYIKGLSDSEINQKIKYSKSEQNDITKKVVLFFYVQMKKEGVI